MASITSTRNEDSDLWVQVIEGSTAAFEIVVAKYQNSVSAVSYSRVGDFNISEDISQETFLAAWQSRDSLGEMGQPNDTQLKRWIGADRSQGRWLGKKYQSRSRFLGRPWIDVQFSDLDFNKPQSKPEYLTARGWIAFGDHADGWLLALGGIARGLIACGGVAIGGICAAVAREANTPQAKSYLDQQWVTGGLKWMERWAWLPYLAFPLGLLPAFGMRLFYRKENLESTPPQCFFHF
ncbi:MAG: hypothetical protein IT422_26695 [Pirellulaceae bacterium]|jgi:hypothetical protein|nr:hypothetical protein [Pirellulaceae bacterium]